MMTTSSRATRQDDAGLAQVVMESFMMRLYVCGRRSEVGRLSEGPGVEAMWCVVCLRDGGTMTESVQAV